MSSLKFKLVSVWSSQGCSETLKMHHTICPSSESQGSYTIRARGTARQEKQCRLAVSLSFPGRCEAVFTLITRKCQVRQGKLSKPDPLPSVLQIQKHLPTFLWGEYSSTVLQRER